MERRALTAKARIVMTTVANPAEGSRMARKLVEERLAACVNVVAGIRSIYRWRGKVVEEGETLLLVKIRPECVEAVESRIREIHSYEVPEILALDVTEASEAYLAWLLGETAGVSGED